MIIFNYGCVKRATFTVFARGWSNVGAKVIKKFKKKFKSLKKIRIGILFTQKI
jgi:hypothetical protein